MRVFRERKKGPESARVLLFFSWWQVKGAAAAAVTKVYPSIAFSPQVVVLSLLGLGQQQK